MCSINIVVRWLFVNILLLFLNNGIIIVFSYPKPDLNEHRPQLASPFRFFPSRVDSLVADYCGKPAQCLNTSYTDLYCFNQRLPYSSTSLDLIPNNESISIQSRFEIFQNLQNFPKCWNVIQPYICAIYMPRCENNSIVLPSLEMCKAARIPCQFVYNSTDLLPRNFFNCDEQFEPKCQNDLLDVRFNNTAVCQKPLVPTNQTEHFYQNIDGCGLQCQNPLYTADEHDEIHHLIAWGSIICLICNVFTVVTFIIDWKNANKYPALVVFYINVCSMISCFGWLLQFYGPDSRTHIVCRKDGTLRTSEPSARENLSCVIDFVLVYYFSMASIVWFVILTYAWHMNFLAQGKVHEKINKQRAYFHLMAWSIPVILSISTMAFGEIDGDYITGICFVGHISTYARILFLIIPFSFALIVGGYFLFKGLSTLIHLQLRSRDIISSKTNRTIKWTILRVGLFTILTYLYGAITLAFNIYMLVNRSYWNDTLNDFIMCKLTQNPSDWNEKCILKERPSFLMLYLQILVYFAANVTSSSWVWTRATIGAWTRYIRRKFGCETEEEPTKLQKHKVIAKAYGKRKVIEQNGRLSISLQQSHTDPVGMNFDLNSIATNEDLSCTWAAALPNLVYRRDALTVVQSSSADSEISISRTRVSYESRRNSVDSQVSVKIFKETHKFNKKDRKRRRRHEVKKGRKKYQTEQAGESAEKQLISLLRQTEQFINKPARKIIKPNMKRRSAISNINDGLANGKLLLPMLLPLQYVRQNKSDKEESGHDAQQTESDNIVPFS